jgi:hypothetical protein
MEKCTLPPKGWLCSREAGHTGPCAAIPEPSPVVNVTIPHLAAGYSVSIEIEERDADGRLVRLGGHKVTGKTSVPFNLSVTLDDVESGDGQSKLNLLRAQVAALTIERDEADRRAGAAEREKADIRKTKNLQTEWLDNAKLRAGHHRNDSFDLVYDELLGIRAETKMLEKDFAGLLEFYGVTTLRQLIDAQALHIARLQAGLPKSANVFPGTPRAG